MNRSRNRRRDLALFRYMRATAHAGQPMPHPPWTTWRRSVCGPPSGPIQLGVDYGSKGDHEMVALTNDGHISYLTLGHTTPAEREALMAEAIAKLTAGLNRVIPLPEGCEFYWAMEDGAPAHAITAEDGTVVYAATAAEPIQLDVVGVTSPAVKALLPPGLAARFATERPTERCGFLRQHEPHDWELIADQGQVVEHPDRYCDGGAK